MIYSKSRLFHVLNIELNYTYGQLDKTGIPDTITMAYDLLQMTSMKSSGKEYADMNNFALSENLPGIDTAFGRHMCNDNRSLYFDLLHKFHGSKRHVDVNIREYLAAGDISAAGRTAHSMKSVAASLGAMDLSVAARLLEEAITDNINDRLEVRLKGFSHALSIVISGLDEAFGSPDETPETQQAAAQVTVRQETGPVTVMACSETILLAEDDRTQMELTAYILESNGYKVFKAYDGAEAVELFKEHMDQIDLVIMDALMPRMTGKHAWDEINAIRPDVKACFVSGYTSDIMGGKLAVDFSLPFISKPVMPATLLRTVRDILDGV